MKKLLTSSLLLALCVSAGAEQKQLLIFESDMKNPQFGDLPLCGLGISPNGKYVCGAFDQGVGMFVADRETGVVKYQIYEEDGGEELRHVDNNGVAIGFDYSALLYDFNGEITRLPVPEGVGYVLGEDITADGQMYVGSLQYTGGIENGVASDAAYMMKGDVDWTVLVRPTEDEFDYFDLSQRGATAKFVSDDRKTILGHVGSFTLPVLWKYNEVGGTYECDFFPIRCLKYKDKDLDDPTKPLFALSGMYLYMSPNGRYVASMGQINIGESNAEADRIMMSVPVVYDTETKEVIIYDEAQEIDMYGVGLYPTGITDDGTFIGCVGQPVFRCYGSFIMKAGETQAKFFKDLYADYNNELGQSDYYGFSIPTGLSADGQYIVGYTYYATDYDDDSPAYYATYVIDTKAPAGVKDIKGAEGEAEVVGIYDVNGQRLEKMTKGLNIVRMSDGTSRKVMVK